MTKQPIPLKNRLAATRDHVDGLQILAGAPASGQIAVPVELLEQVSDLMSEAIHDIETRRSMIDETVAALRGRDVLVKAQELRAISAVTADLRNGLTVMPDDTSGRELIVRAMQKAYATLGAITARDRSWT